LFGGGLFWAKLITILFIEILIVVEASKLEKKDAEKG
jgi:hypothetical protein